MGTGTSSARRTRDISNGRDRRGHEDGAGARGLDSRLRVRHELHGESVREERSLDAAPGDWRRRGQRVVDERPAIPRTLTNVQKAAYTIESNSHNPSIYLSNFSHSVLPVDKRYRA